MTPTHATKRGCRYRYYISASLLGRGPVGPNTMRVPAGEIEGLVLDQIRQLIGSPPQLADALLPLGLTTEELDLRMHRAENLATQWVTMTSEIQRELVKQIVSRVTLSVGQIALSIGLARFEALLGGRATRAIPTEPVLTVQIPAKLRRFGKGKRIIIGDTHTNTIDPGLAGLIHEALAVRSVVLADTLARPSTRSQHAGRAT